MLPYHCPSPAISSKKMNGAVRSALRWTAGIIGGVVALAVIVITVAVWILTPSRLTPIVTNAANSNLNADVTLSRAELTFWKTFPTLHISLDLLTVRTRAFDSLSTGQRSHIPEWADTVIHIDHFGGGINVAALLAGRISLHDIVIGGACINAAVIDSSTVSYDILPPSPADDDDKTSTALPDISINRFEIADALPVRYFSVPDSIDVCVTLEKSAVITRDTPAYRLRLDSSIAALLPPGVSLDSLTLGIDGHLEWRREEGSDRFQFRDFTVMLNPVKALVNASITLGNPMSLDEFTVSLDRIPVTETLAMMPPQWLPALPQMETDMAVSADATLVRPFLLNDSLLPSVAVTVRIPPCSVTCDGYTVSRFTLDAEANIDGSVPDRSTATLKSLSAKGEGLAIALNGTVATPLSAPCINLHADGNVNLVGLPKSFLAAIPGTVKGRIDLDTDTRLHLSDLTPGRFHRLYIKGDIDLSDIRISSDKLGIDLYTRNACLKLGTNNGFVTDKQRIDSLLTASLLIDTLAMQTEGITLKLKDLKGGIGCSNNAASADTSAINPIGGTIKISRLTYTDPDSMRVIVRDLYTRASLQRFNQLSRVPLLSLSAGMKSMFYADSMNRMILRKGNLDMTAHMRPVNAIDKRLKERYDSLSAIYPQASPDSIVAIMRSTMPRRNVVDMTKYDVVDFGVDGTTKRMLRRWNVAGTLTAERGRLFTPYFPLRNRFDNLDMIFSTDSVILHDVSYHAGKSDFLINGGVRNIRRALTSRRPIRFELTVSSDTLNINELVQASYNGAAFAGQIKDGTVTLASVDSETDIDHLSDSISSGGVTAALLVPVNITADISMRARNIIYSDMFMNDFNGELHVKDGAINLSDLSARSGIGNARLTALYTAPTKSDIRFGFGLELNDVHVKEFIGMMPAVDSLMPLLNSFEGRVNAEVAATAGIDSLMNIDLSSLNAAVRLEGRDLVLLDAETFRTLSKWLLFKDKKTNIIPSMEVEMLVKDSKVELFPFVFDFDRYRLAVMGSNDLAMNYKYHVSVLKSPIPFKFGINLSGNADKMKVRLGRAKYKPDRAGETIAIVDTTRINLLKEIDNVFRRGARNARLGPLKPAARPAEIDFSEASDTISHEDSLIFINHGLLPAPPAPEVTAEPAIKQKKK